MNYRILHRTACQHARAVRGAQERTMDAAVEIKRAGE